MKKNKEHNDKLFPGLGMSAIGLTLSTMLHGGMKKMLFGNESELPKGVVKEMMHGIMLGVQDMIKEKEYEIDSLKEQLETIKNDNKHLEKEKSIFKSQYEEAMEFISKDKTKHHKVKRKPGPKPKKI